MRTTTFSPSTLLAAAALLGLLACTGSGSEAAHGSSSGSTASSGPTGSGGSAAAGGTGGVETGGAGTGGEAGAPPELFALFIGNSYTYVNDLPGLVHELAATTEGGPTIDVSSVVAGGASFATHWNGPDAQPAIATGDDSHVVLQGQSVEPILGPADFHDFGSLLAAAVSAAGATPVLYETWARKAGDPIYDTPESGGSPDAMQDALSAAYETLAMQTGATVAPVGEAWRIAWTQHPEIELYQSDGSHPSPAGTYLAGCVLYIVLTGHTPSAASAIPDGASPADAAALREIATQATAAR